MIRNLTVGAGRVPPAVPVVTRYLEQWFAASRLAPRTRVR